MACSAEGAALCYRTIALEAPARMGRNAHPEISLHTHSLADYERLLERGDLDGVAALMLDSAGRLARIGADFLVCPDNTIHVAFDRVAPRSPLPWLHIAEVVAAEAAARGFRRLGLLGTRWLVESEVYPSRLAARGMGYVRPSPDEREMMSRIILDELVRGVIDSASVARLEAIVSHFKVETCDAVVLGCTELPLVLDDRNSALPVLDSPRLLARAALRHAIGGATGEI